MIATSSLLHAYSKFINYFGNPIPIYYYCIKNIMKRIGIFFASTSGNTEKAARKIRDELGIEKDHLYNVAVAKAGQLEQYDLCIFGIPTWGVGELHDDWDGFLPELSKADLSNRMVAIFGMGDQEGNPDSFCDAMGLIYDLLKERDVTIIGQWSDRGYDFDMSEAHRKDHFVGLALDEDNQPDRTEGRIREWVKGLQANMN